MALTKLPYCILNFRDKTLYIKFNGPLQLTADIIKEIHTEGVRLSEGKPYYIITDVRIELSSSSETRKYGADIEFIKYHLAHAIVANSLPVRLLSNFFININKPKVPTRLFKDEANARLWILKLKAKSPNRQSAIVF